MTGLSGPATQRISRRMERRHIESMQQFFHAIRARKAACPASRTA